MENHTTQTYRMKREILQYVKRISEGTGMDIRKFAADMTYGILGSEGCVLSRIADTLDKCDSDKFETNCYHKNPSNARYCEICGKQTIYFTNNYLLTWQEERSEYIVKSTHI